jgi:tripartite-type tricarboxylate transporter receptor subunit TctC
MRSGLIWCVAFAFAATLAADGAAAQASQAQSWPAKSMRIIVPYPPGGLSDVFARLIGDKLARLLGQSVVIDNRPGGNTIIGTQATAQSAAVNQVLADPDTIARGRTLGLRIGGGPPEQLRQIMDKVTEIYAKVVVSANIRPE